MKLRALFIVVSSALLSAGCQSTGSHPGSLPSTSSFAHQNYYPSSPAIPGPVDWTRGAGKDHADQEQEEDDSPDLWQRIRSELSWQDIENQQVEQAVDDYLAQPSYMPEVSERGALYLHYIVEEVERRNMPIEIALVPLVESTLDPFAYSPGAAAGLWQITPKTGENLGLQQDGWFDGRRALRPSTQVALDYLEQLHEDFDDDWLLALAAYNAGEGRVARARQSNLEKGLPTDFWSLDLPRETRRYVPKLLALSQILAEPEAHAVELPAIADEPAFEIAEVDGQIDLVRAAELANVSVETLRELNPGQLRLATAPGQTQELLVPVGSSARLEEEVAQLTPAERIRWRNYIVRRGDSLAGIAKKFHTTADLIRRVNGISGNGVRAGSGLMVPSKNWTSELALSRLPASPEIGYQVQRGDSLSRIAGKYRISVEDIVAWNALDPGQYLQPGQTLRLRVGGS